MTPDESPRLPEQVPTVRVTVRVRLAAGATIGLGPGRADLLEAIAETGSISAAARDMEMSYKRAWSLVHAMNKAFGEPVVQCETGGTRGGGAALTPLGQQVLAAFRAAEQDATRAAAPHFDALLSRLNPPVP